MHIVIINGSPRVKRHSNTDKIIQSFGKGLENAGATYETYSLSDRNEWDEARNAFMNNNNILIALPLFVESAPSLLLEFLETLPTERTIEAQLSFILQSGFAEGYQLRCGEKFLQSLPQQLGCTYGGCLVRGNNFGIRVEQGKKRERMLKPYQKMGYLYGTKGDFFSKKAKQFTGLERFPWLLRKMIGFMLKHGSRKQWNDVALKWGCTQPLDHKPY